MFSVSTLFLSSKRSKARLWFYLVIMTAAGKPVHIDWVTSPKQKAGDYEWWGPMGLSPVLAATTVHSPGSVGILDILGGTVVTLMASGCWRSPLDLIRPLSERVWIELFCAERFCHSLSCNFILMRYFYASKLCFSVSKIIPEIEMNI